MNEQMKNITEVEERSSEYSKAVKMKEYLELLFVDMPDVWIETNGDYGERREFIIYMRIRD